MKNPIPILATIASILALLGASASAGVNVSSANLTAHFDAGDLNNDGGATDPGNGGTVSTWTNLVTTTTLNHDTSGGTPIFVSPGNGGINNLATVRLTDESPKGDILFNNAMNVSAQTVFAVLTMNDSGIGLSTLLSDGSHGPNIRQDSNNAAYFVGNNDDFVQDGTNGTFSINGSAGRTVTFGQVHILEVVRDSQTTFGGLRIGDNVVNPGRRWDGDVAEILIYDGALSEADRNQVGNFLADKYNISTSYAQPTEFNGGDMLTAGDWSDGLPVSPDRFGTSALDGTFDDGNAGVADWALTVSGGTITAGQNWNFTGASNIGIGGGALNVAGDVRLEGTSAMNFSGGTLDVAGDILVEDSSVITFSGGTVSWDGKLDTGTSIDSKIVISGGTFDGTATGATTFGNPTGAGELVITGGTISASVFDFSSSSSLSSLGGSAALDGTSSTFGVLDIGTDWTGSFTLTSFSGTDWEDEFVAGNITLDGAILDAEGFADNFAVSNGDQTLAYDPRTEFLGGELLDALNWTNGLPAGVTVATIALDGSINGTNFGFGPGTTVNMTAGTLTSTGTNGFNTVGGGTWNISGGRIVTNCFLPNSGNGNHSIVNLSGGTIELADVDGGDQFIAVANGAALNISGSAMLDATQADLDLPTTGGYNGTIDIKSDWTGTWTWGTHAGYDWENLFLAGTITLDGVVLDLAGFEANFAVTNGGQTLAIGTGGTPDQGSPILIATGFNEFDEFVIDAVNLNPAKTYDLKRGTDLGSFPDFVDVPTDGGTTFQFIDDNPPADRAFYRIEEQ